MTNILTKIIIYAYGLVNSIILLQFDMLLIVAHILGFRKITVKNYGHFG